MNIFHPALQFLIALLAVWINRRQQETIEYLREENRVLREKLGHRRIRLNDDQRRRLAVKGKSLGRKLLSKIAGIVNPDTILRWYRMLIANKYDGSKKRRPGRPGTKEDIANLVIDFASQNPRWGYTRIRGALRNIGHDIGRNTIKRILNDAGLEPAPERGSKTSWKTFLSSHWQALAAADFFTTEVLTLGGLVRYHVFFVMNLFSRKVEIAGITSQPTSACMQQVCRNLLDCVDGFLINMRYLIMDRDPLYTEAFRSLLSENGVNPIRLPARSPNLNAYAERFVLSIKSECLDRMVILGERHLRSAISDYVEHYHRERNHQGLKNKLIESFLPEAANLSNCDPEVAAAADGPIKCHRRLGGLLNYYYRAA